MKKVLISCGPIPGRLDSVKFITNRFKGGLAFKTAEELSKDFDVTIIKWKYTDYTGKLNVINVDDIYQYFGYITNNEYDGYILAAAVANLIPSEPWEGKFPSHNYKVGEEFDIKFTIAPRVIDEVKKKYPRCTLIGYKLYDGTDDEIIKAGWETMKHSKANCVFCNHPATAKAKKIALLPDGSEHELNWEEHINFIKRILNLKWYKTNQTVLKSVGYEDISKIEPEIIKQLNEFLDQVKIEKNGYYFGTVAIREGKCNSNSIITTTRGKEGNLFARNFDVIHDYNDILGPKMTLNMPMIDLLFKKFPQHSVILHGHEKINQAMTIPHYFDGTTETSIIANKLPKTNATNPFCFNVSKHGYYALFVDVEQAKDWLYKKHMKSLVTKLNKHENRLAKI